MMFLIGIVGILVSVALHAIAMTSLIAVMKQYGKPTLDRFRRGGPPFLLASAACALAVKHTLDIVFWASAFWMFAGPQFSKFEDAVYFSSVTYTTLGYGDIVIAGRWRMLCSFEATSGLILFGLSTALLFVIVQRIWAADTWAASENRKTS